MKIGNVELNCEQLERLEDERIFRVRIVEGGVRLTECCDQCFEVDLSVQELYRLSGELAEIAFRIDPKNEGLIAAREMIKNWYFDNPIVPKQEGEIIEIGIKPI